MALPSQGADQTSAGKKWQLLADRRLPQLFPIPQKIGVAPFQELYHRPQNNPRRRTQQIVDDLVNSRIWKLPRPVPATGPHREYRRTPDAYRLYHTNRLMAEITDCCRRQRRRGASLASRLRYLLGHRLFARFPHGPQLLAPNSFN